jgi:hypothetical protein
MAKALECIILIKTEKSDMTDQNKTEEVNGNEAEEFIKKIVIKVIITTAILVIGVGVAVYYTSGAV